MRRWRRRPRAGSAARPRSPRGCPRAAAELLGSTLSLRLVDRAEEDEVHRALRVRSTLAWLTAATLDEDRPLADTLLGSPSLLDLLPADGVVVNLQGHTGSLGVRLPEDRLRAELARLRGRPVDEVCDELLARLLPDGAEDDVVLVAVHLRPDEPGAGS